MPAIPVKIALRASHRLLAMNPILLLIIALLFVPITGGLLAATPTGAPAWQISTPTPTPTPAWVTIRVHAEGGVQLDHLGGPGIPNVQVNLYLFVTTVGTPLAYSCTDENGFYSITATYGMPYGRRETFSVYPAQSELYSFTPQWGNSRTCSSDCSFFGGSFVAHPKRPFFLPLLMVQKGPYFTDEQGHSHQGKDTQPEQTDDAP